MSTAASLSVIFYLLACAYRHRVSSRGCNSVLKPLVRHEYILIIVSAPGTRQQRANRMTLKYLSPTSLRRIKFGVRGNSQLSRSTLCGSMHAHTHPRTNTKSPPLVGYVDRDKRLMYHLAVLNIKGGQGDKALIGTIKADEQDLRAWERRGCVCHSAANTSQNPEVEARSFPVQNAMSVCVCVCVCVCV